MTAEVVVRRCRVRIVRRGGWSWGAAPRALVDRVIDALPQLIAGQVSELDRPGSVVEIVEPVHVTASVGLSELLGPPQARYEGAATIPRHPAAVVVTPSDGEQSGPSQARYEGAATISSYPAAVDVPAADREPGPSVLYHDDVPTLLGYLAAHEDLARLLALIPVATLRLWRGALLGALAGGSAGLATVDSTVTVPASQAKGSAVDHRLHEVVVALASALAGVREVEDDAGDGGSEGPVGSVAVAPGNGSAATIDPTVSGSAITDSAGGAGSVAGAGSASSLGPTGGAGRAASSTGAGSTGEAVSGDTGYAVDPASAVRADLVAIAATAARFGPSTVERALDVLGAGSDAQWSTGGSRPQARHADPSQPTGPQLATSVQTAAIQAGSVEVDSALPFLLLRPLSMIGYLDALGPALSVTRVPDATTAFATCLAYAVLGSLDRGWRRAAGDRTAAAVFAGLQEPLPEPGLVGFVRAAAPALPGLDAVLARSLADGHRVGQPLLLTAAGEACGGGLVLSDVEGLFPIAWADAVEDLLPAWSACGAPPVLLRPTELPAGTPDRLHRNGVTFVADAPPIRHERWRRLPRAPLWTNAADGPLAPLRKVAADFAGVAGRMDEVVGALAGQRAAVPLAGGSALNRSVTLAAAVGLGTIAWMLWRSREVPDPLLALERFHDLSARIQIDQHRVRVVLPLGRRHADLRDHGLLADVHRVPWLHGRVVELSGG